MEEQQQELDIRRYLQIVYKKRHLFIMVTAGLITVGTAVSYLKPEIYEASSTVSIERNYLNMLIRDIAAPSSMDQEVQALSIVMTSRSTLTRALTDLSIDMSGKTEAETERLVNHFQKSTRIKSDLGRAGGRDMNIFTVTYRDKEPRFARDYVNALVKRYIADSTASKRKEAWGANRFIYEQMELYKKKIDQTEKEIDERRKQRGAQASERLAALQRKYDDLLMQYTGKHPEIIRLKDEIETTRQQIRKQEHPSLTHNEIDNYDEKRGPSRRDSGKSISDLERDRDAYKKVYESLVASLGKSEVSAQVEAQAKADTFSILEAAVLPINPVSRPRWIFMLMGIAFGIAGGAGTVIFLDMTDQTIKNLHTLKEFGLPVIGVIPRIQSVDAIVAARKKDVLAYAFAGLYLAGIAVVVVVERMR